jgi:ketosteroid isomerase-like protein
MSQENVAVVRRGLEAWNAGDLDALRDELDSGIVWRGPEGWPEPGPYAGQEAVMRQFEHMRDAFDFDRFELISDFTEVGDRVAVRLIWQGEGSGPNSSMELTGLYTVREGKCLAIDLFWDHAEALEALGLSG